jgi:hypothetical protein
MAVAHRASTAAHYPFGIVAVNVVLMLADVLMLKGRAFIQTPARGWEAFAMLNDDNDDGFNRDRSFGNSSGRPEDTNLSNFEGFGELFTLSLKHVDYLWTTEGATRADFGRIIKLTKGAVVEVLAEGPRDVVELLDVAVRRGLAH